MQDPPHLCDVTVRASTSELTKPECCFLVMVICPCGWQAITRLQHTHACLHTSTHNFRKATCAHTHAHAHAGMQAVNIMSRLRSELEIDPCNCQTAACGARFTTYTHARSRALMHASCGMTLHQHTSLEPSTNTPSSAPTCLPQPQSLVQLATSSPIIRFLCQEMSDPEDDPETNWKAFFVLTLMATPSPNMTELKAIASTRLPGNDTPIQALARFVRNSLETADVSDDFTPFELVLKTFNNIAVLADYNARMGAIRTPRFLDAINKVVMAPRVTREYAECVAYAWFNLTDKEGTGQTDDAALRLLLQHSPMPPLMRALAASLQAQCTKPPAANRERMSIQGVVEQNPTEPCYALMLIESVCNLGKEAEVASTPGMLDAVNKCFEALRHGRIDADAMNNAAMVMALLCRSAEARGLLMAHPPSVCIGLKVAETAAEHDGQPDELIKAIRATIAAGEVHMARQQQGAAAASAVAGSSASSGSGRGSSSSEAAAPKGSSVKRCCVCGKTAQEAGLRKLLVCTRCNSVVYCGKDCQVRLV